MPPRRDDLVVTMSASYAVHRGFAPRTGHSIDHLKMVHSVSLFDTQACSFDSAT